MATLLSLRLLGEFSATVAGTPLLALKTRKQLWLLALLGLRAGREVERDFLIGTLWPESDLEKGSGSLTRALNDLKRALGPAAVLLEFPSRRTLRLTRGAELEVDVLAFDTAVARWEKGQALTDAEEAVRLYRGPLLPSCDALWVAAERLARQEQAVGLLLTLARRVPRERALALLRTAEGLEPLRDEIQQALYETLVAGGSLPAALLAYRSFRQRLHTEANTEPSPTTKALIERLKQAPPPTPTPTAPTRLPAFFSSLLGREQEIETLARQLRSVRLLTLLGPGGVGKTRLAVATAATLNEPAYFIDLTPLPIESDAERVQDALERALELPAGTLLTALRERSVVLVLDNAEHVTAELARLLPRLLAAAPRVRVLVTSRVALGVAGEQLWPVAPLSDDTATALLAERSGKPALRESPEARALVRRLDGLPLAIEFAAARLRSLPLAQLTHALDLAGGASGTANPHQRTLRTSLDWSHSLLSESDQQVFAALAVFVGGWRFEAAEAICGRTTHESLPRLVEHSLVVFEGERYRFLETVRAYASEKLDQSNQRALCQQRLIGYMTGIVEELHAALDTPLALSWYTLLDSERENLRAALALASPALRYRLAAQLAFYAQMRGLRREALGWLEGVEQATDLPTLVRADALYALGYLGREKATRVRHYEAALVLYRQLQEHGRESALLSNLGLLLATTGEELKGEQLLKQALALGREQGEAVRIGLACYHLAVVADQRRGTAEVQSYLEEAITQWRLAGITDGEQIALHMLGTAAVREQDWERARHYLEQALALARKLGMRHSEAVELYQLARVAQKEERGAQAVQLAQESLEILVEIGEPELEGAVRRFLESAP